MKFLSRILILNIIIILLYSCAKPTVVKIVLPEDEKLNCKQLEVQIDETIKIKKEAEYAKEATGGNLTRAILFWPAWAQTLHNADVAIMAANDRNYHLISLMKKKDCANLDKMDAEVTNSKSLKSNIAQQLKDLKNLYDNGDLTKEEYKKAKNKVLSQ
jgi:hypothetical protein